MVEAVFCSPVEFDRIARAIHQAIVLLHTAPLSCQGGGCVLSVALTEKFLFRFHEKDHFRCARGLPSILTVAEMGVTLACKGRP